MPTFTKALIPDFGLPDFPTFGLYIEGTNFNDSLYGTVNADGIYGRLGSDFLFGGGGDDLLFGEEGNDSLSGGSGNDRLDGGAGNDSLEGGSGADTLIGGEGFDTISYASSSGSVCVNLAENVGYYGDAEGDTFSGIDKVIGSSHVDVLFADDTGVMLDGGAGHDYLKGGAGLDVLTGGSGDDTLHGGRGLDVLTGGSGADHFEFNLGDGSDLVNDFQQGMDKIVLGEGFEFIPFGLDQELLSGTELPPYYHFHPGAYRTDRLFFDTDDHQLYELSRFGGAELLATFANGVQLQTSDFLI
jgi:Ca2+-binding RTX toxin-like protein